MLAKIFKHSFSTTKKLGKDTNQAYALGVYAKEFLENGKPS